MANAKPPALLVVNIETGEVVTRVEVSNPTAHKVEKVLTGMLNRIDSDRFFVDDGEFDHLFKDA